MAQRHGLTFFLFQVQTFLHFHSLIAQTSTVSVISRQAGGGQGILHNTLQQSWSVQKQNDDNHGDRINIVISMSELLYTSIIIINRNGVFHSFNKYITAMS